MKLPTIETAPREEGEPLMLFCVEQGGWRFGRLREDAPEYAGQHPRSSQCQMVAIEIERLSSGIGEQALSRAAEDRAHRVEPQIGGSAEPRQPIRQRPQTVLV
jgi:hypothetical protein